MIASLRFKGLEVVTAPPPHSLRPSPNLDNAKLTGGVTSMSKGKIFCFSKLFRTVGLMLPLLLFSCPILDSDEELGWELPLSDVELNARLSGLFGDIRVLDVARGVTVFERCADRSDNFTLEGKGLARGDGVCVGVPVKTVGG
jgi:hypothetical protein